MFAERKEDSIKGGKRKRELAHDAIFSLSPQERHKRVSAFPVLKAFQQRSWHTDLEEPELIN